MWIAWNMFLSSLALQERCKSCLIDTNNQSLSYHKVWWHPQHNHLFWFSIFQVLFINTVILFWPRKMLTSLPWSDKFSSLWSLKMYDRYAGFPSQISLATSEARAWLCVCKKTKNSHSSNALPRNFQWGSCRTSVLSQTFECFEPSCHCRTSKVFEI